MQFEVPPSRFCIVAMCVWVGKALGGMCCGITKLLREPRGVLSEDQAMQKVFLLPSKAGSVAQDYLHISRLLEARKGILRQVARLFVLGARASTAAA